MALSQPTTEKTTDLLTQMKTAVKAPSVSVRLYSYLFVTILIRDMLWPIDQLPRKGKGMSTVTISMPESLREFVDAQMKRQGFDNVSEYFRALVREQQAKEADGQLEALLLEGLESGEDIKVTPEFWKDLKAEATALLKKHPPKLRQRRKK